MFVIRHLQMSLNTLLIVLLGFSGKYKYNQITKQNAHIFGVNNY